MVSLVKTAPDANNEYTNGRKLARKSNGDLWCVYFYYSDTAGDYQVYASYSTDGGLTWTEEQVSDDSEGAYNPSIAIDSNDHIHVVWQNSATDKILYRKRTTSWQPIEQVTDADFFGAWEPAIAIDSSDNVLVSWGGRRLVPPYTSFIWYRKRTLTWQTTEQVSPTNSYYTQGPSLAIDSQDHAHAVWMGADGQVHYRHRGAFSWDAEEVLTSAASNQYYPVVAIDSADNVHVVWAGMGWGINPGAFNVQYRKRTGGVWQTQEAVTDDAEYNDDCSIALEEDDDIHVVWRHSNAQTTLMHRKRTTSWQAPEVVSPAVDYWQDYPNLLWALHPTVGGQKTNVLGNEFFFEFVHQETTGVDPSIKFFTSVSGVARSMAINVY